MRTIFLTAAVAFVLAGCEGDKPANVAKIEAATTEAPKADAAKTAIPAAVGAVKDTAGAALASATKAEIACAHCVYHVAGVTSCQPAVKVGGQTLLLTGAVADAAFKSNADLHTSSKSVTLEGKIDGKNYVATKVDIAK